MPNKTSSPSFHHKFTVMTLLFCCTFFASSSSSSRPIKHYDTSFSHSSSSFSAVEPPSPPCSLNGDKDDSRSGICICDKPWTGDECEVLQVLPVSFPQGYGMTPNKRTTWGGDILFRNGKYHLYASAMRNGCSLRQWTTHSQIEHAVSESIMGPFVFQDIAIPTFSHNPKIIELADGKLALIHIGTGASSPRIAEGACRSDLLDNGNGDDKNTMYRTKEGRRFDRANSRNEEGQGSTIHVADSVDGPWTPLQNHTLGQCNNPAPFVVFASCEKAHIIYIVCSWGGHSVLKRAEDIRGPWETVSVVNFTTNTDEKEDSSSDIHYEDPALYIDHRGFHIIYHAYVINEHPPHGHDCTESTVSKLLFSPDGKTWHTASGHPYGTQIEVEGQGTITVATRERPSLLFQKDAASGQARLTHVLNGVCSAPNCPEGPPAGCVNCKYDHWDYTLIQPLVI